MALERRVDYVPNHREFGKFMRSEQAREPAIRAAHDVVAIAQRITPRSNKPGKHLADQYKVNRRPPHVVIKGNPRAIAEVYNNDRGSVPNEFGNPNRGQKAQRSLGRAGAQVGQLRGEAR